MVRLCRSDSAESLRLSDPSQKKALRLCLMHTISRDSPCYYLTSVAKDRLSVFRTDEIKLVTCAALNEARDSGNFALYAYVLMPDHLHVITNSSLPPSKTLQFINGITSRRIIDHLKKQGYEDSLAKLRHETRRRRYSYSVWDHHPNARLLWNENMLMERVQYTHQNPVRGGLVHHPEEYRWSSVRCWKKNILEDEPLLMNIDRISWRRS
jgi:REP-associated tyrosine transposase